MKSKAGESIKNREKEDEVQVQSKERTMSRRKRVKVEGTKDVLSCDGYFTGSAKRGVLAELPHLGGCCLRKAL